LRFVSAATVASGAMQVIAPDRVLAQIDVESTPASRQLFASIGMFMVVTGGMLFNAMGRGDDNATVLLWSGLQKFGAAGMVAIGVRRGVIGKRALGVAGFDLASGVLCLAYRRRLARA
jgi:hypothetical protein